MSHSAIQVAVLLHHYYSPQSYDDPQSPASFEAHDYWCLKGCLVVCDTSEVEIGYSITDRGNAMVQLWLRQELPEKEVRWVDSDGNVIEI